MKAGEKNYGNTFNNASWNKFHFTLERNFRLQTEISSCCNSFAWKTYWSNNYCKFLFMIIFVDGSYVNDTREYILLHSSHSAPPALKIAKDPFMNFWPSLYSQKQLHLKSYPDVFTALETSTFTVGLIKTPLTFVYILNDQFKPYS